MKERTSGRDRYSVLAWATGVAAVLPPLRRTRQIKDAKLEIIDNAGHAVFIDQPQRFRSLLADFVQRL
jgi:pimeloyl-ACP methyl ester carboxylesterase